MPNTIEVVVSFDNVSEMLAQRWETAAMPTVQGAMWTALSWLQAEAVKEAPAHEGFLRNSISLDLMEDYPNASGRIFSTLAHAPVMEYGRRAGARMPPSEALERWGQLVLKESGLGFVLARSIAKKGIKGHHFFQKSYDKNKSRIEDLFGQSIGIALRTM